jgi:NAD(P)-dependent dehydrogenase (short-subunit alcohol dehydrogenase family)
VSDLPSRAALVTGGSSGIGLAIAKALSAEGFSLTLVSRRPEKVEAAAQELGAHAIAADLSTPEGCEPVVRGHIDKWGRLDVLVNSAGVGFGGPIEQMEPKHIGMQIAVNLGGLLLVTRAAIPHLRETKGLIVNLASIAGTVATPGLAVYGATKAAVIAVTRSLNAELEDDGIRATAISPAFVDTPMAQWSGLSSEEMIQPEDCAQVVLMLLRLSSRARIPNVVIERVGEGFA